MKDHLIKYIKERLENALTRFFENEGLEGLEDRNLDLDTVLLEGIAHELKARRPHLVMIVGPPECFNLRVDSSQN